MGTCSEAAHRQIASFSGLLPAVSMVRPFHSRQPSNPPCLAALEHSSLRVLKGSLASSWAKIKLQDHHYLANCSSERTCTLTHEAVCVCTAGHVCKHGRNMPKIRPVNYKLRLNVASKCSRVIESSVCPPPLPRPGFSSGRAPVE